MKERPILFSGPMVRAILEGKKTVTRRVVNPLCRDLPIVSFERWGIEYPQLKLTDWQYERGNPLWVSTETDGTTRQWHCPYGEQGDRLWVRETWCPEGDAGACWYRAGVPVYDVREIVGWSDYPYRLGEFLDPPAKMTWKPSIFMPRWASRITLDVIGVRVERLQDISEIDCEHELGVEPYRLGSDAYPRFKELWDSINAKRGYSFESNPWVWRVEFRKVHP